MLCTGLENIINHVIFSISDIKSNEYLKCLKKRHFEIRKKPLNISNPYENDILRYRSVEEYLKSPNTGLLEIFSRSKISQTPLEAAI